jgi:hypothetical protein
MIPCLLHLKKNTQEALVTLWLNDVYDASIRPDLKTQDERKKIIDQAQMLINKKGLRKMEASVQWEVPRLDKGRGCGRISLEIYLGSKG